MLNANPALQAFEESIGLGMVWGQVWIERVENGFLLRHVADRAVNREQLGKVSPKELRSIAMFTASGAFRPLRSSPDLISGWVIFCANSGELWQGVQELYPGSVPDWFAAQGGQPPVTDYREFTNRQTGMYRITQLLTDQQATEVTRAACHERFCLKRRLWTVGGAKRDDRSRKSEIPCLEPCAVLLELARKAARIEQEEKLTVKLSKSELESLLAAVKAALQSGSAGERTGDIGASANPRRLQLLLEKYKDALTQESKHEEE